MKDERRRQPIKSEEELDTLIPADERTRLEAIEQLRFELRERFADHAATAQDRAHFWRDKLVAPAIVVLLTVALSGFGIPMVLKSIDNTRRDREITAELLQEVAQHTAEMQAAIDARADGIDAYWADVSRTNAVLGEFALKRDIGDISVDEFNRQDTLIENDRKRISESLDASAHAYTQQLRMFRPWVHRTRMRINFTYPAGGDRIAAEKALLALGTELDQVDEWLGQRHDTYQKRLYKDIAIVKAERQSFRKQQITQSDYVARVNVILEKLRAPAPIDGPMYKLKANSVDKVLKFVAEKRPSI